MPVAVATVIEHPDPDRGLLAYRRVTKGLGKVAVDREHLIDCMGESRNFECFATQAELFQKEEDEEGEEAEEA